MNPRILVIGVGPIGGIIGGRLARAGNDITFVDVDKEHVTAIREKGLQVDVPDGPFNVTINVVYPDEIQGKFDIAGIAVRSNYTPDALTTAIAHLADNGLLMSMQNGINPPLLQEKVGADRTVGMAIRMGSRKVAPGHLHTATRGPFTRRSTKSSARVNWCGELDIRAHAGSCRWTRNWSLSTSIATSTPPRRGC